MWKERGRREEERMHLTVTGEGISVLWAVWFQTP